MRSRSVAPATNTAVLAPAKINLMLEVLARREDGYHALRSVMVPIGLCDELTFEPHGSFTFVCDPPSLAADNLVVRALDRLGLSQARLAVTLRKRIPAGAGLGGGSSDAAAVLRAAMDGAFGPLGTRDWLGDARALGSDVPFFLVDGPALVEGTGERVTALGRPPPWWVVLALPATPVPTASAYAALDAARVASPPPSRPRGASPALACAEALQRADFPAVLATMTNDFETVVCAGFPEVRAALRALERAASPRRAMLSGSGGACFALAEHEDEARAIAAQLAGSLAFEVRVVPFAGSAAWR